MKREDRDNVHYRKHDIIIMGDMQFANGFGFRHDCMRCVNGIEVDGSKCSVCGPKLEKKRIKYLPW